MLKLRNGMIDGGRTALPPEHPWAGPAQGWYEAWLLPEPHFDLEALKRDGALMGLLIPGADRLFELLAPGYERLAVDVQGCVEGALVTHAVQFGQGGETWPSLWGAALFDSGGGLVAKGPIGVKSTGAAGARLCFSSVIVILNPEKVCA